MIATLSPQKIFQPTLPARGATRQVTKGVITMKFQPTLPARGATPELSLAPPARTISTHAPRTGSDALVTHEGKRDKDFNPRSPHGERLNCCATMIAKVKFQPTLPARGATQGFKSREEPRNDFNPRSPHGERRRVPDERRTYCSISTHAPRTGSDKICEPVGCTESISTHAPRTGSDYVGDGCGKKSNDFNPRSPHGERRRDLHHDAFHRIISTHAPRTGSDRCRYHSFRHARKFQPTLPARGATSHRQRADARRPYFNPRSPHGERPLSASHSEMASHFNPRSPHGERHSSAPANTSPPGISTHAPRTGSDAFRSIRSLDVMNFNPRSPHGERPGCDDDADSAVLISTHAPRTGSDRSRIERCAIFFAFQPTLPARGATLR